jgi:hypothetical protein
VAEAENEGITSVATVVIALARELLEKVEGSKDKRYTGLTIQDLRRSAIKNLMKAGPPEKVVMTISATRQAMFLTATLSSLRTC